MTEAEVVNVLVKISARVAKLYGLDEPQRIEASGQNGGPIQTQEQRPDFSKLTLEERLAFEQLMTKAGRRA